MKAFDEFAKEVAGQVDNENQRLNNEKAKLETDLRKVSELIPLVEQKKRRVVAYTSDSGLCPFCFIHNNLSVEMKPVPSNSDIDIMKCKHCASELEIES
jgi:hypothetical protein